MADNFSYRPLSTSAIQSMLKTSITTLMDERYRNPTPFETFANQLLNLGVMRLTFDAIKDEMSFYTPNQFVCSLSRPDLVKDKKIIHWNAGEKLEVSRLEKAIKQLDAGEIPSTEFHREMFAAGVIFCDVYLIPRKIYYMGKDGQHYLEEY